MQILNLITINVVFSKQNNYLIYIQGVNRREVAKSKVESVFDTIMINFFKFSTN